MSEQKYTQTWFWPLLAIIFAGLKLAGVISWSWLWIAAPIWLPIVILSVMWLVGSVILCMITGVNKVFEKLLKATEK